jgi:hypothetical protein
MFVGRGFDDYTIERDSYHGTWEGMSTAFRLAGPLLFTVPVVLVLLACRQGIALDWDAVVYLSAAESFADTGRLIDLHGRVLTTFAPGLPTLVGLLLKTGASFNVVGIAISVVAVTITIVCTYLVAREVLESTLLSWIAVAVVGLSVSTVRVFAYLKTEAPFSALVMLTLALCLWAIRNYRTPPWWLLSVAATISAATTVRYIGFTLIPMAALAGFLATRDRGAWKSARSAVLTGVAASAGLALVSLRNANLGSPPLGERSPSGLTALRVISDTLQVFGSYILPSQPGGVVQIVSGVIVVGLIALGGVAASRRRSSAGLFLFVFVCGYVATIIYSEFEAVIQPVSERLLSPVFPPIVILAIMGLSWLCGFPLNRSGQVGNGFHRFITKPLTLGLLAITLITSAWSSGTFARMSGQDGVGYNSIASRTSPTAQAVRALPPDVGIAAMNGPRVYMATRRRPIAVIPWTNFFSRPETVEPRIRTLKAQVSSGRVRYLVYFTSDAANDVVTPKQLTASGLRLRKIARYPDGEIWEAST